ncbi:hypothetical protein [Kribbella sindirgiensis]|uniref:Uncharacterized protein n=1 Tax=Kribbella sindirgiensis TaxID=1124744 RepID=A0A4R0I8C9_9ACTN|nr:hypothetical protein [Kribbella sindirgiensis]TCC28469.1 hypothetical protein E0H50_29665 [Kribbella sindirgiensis]
MRRPKNVLLRCAAVLAAGLGFTFAAAGLADAAGPQPVAPAELSKATDAARSSEALSLLGKAGGTAKAAASVARDTRPIYALNPAFVRDAAAPVATFWYAATTAAQGGRTLTVFTTPDEKGAWHAVNVASGNTEARMVSAAAGALVFTEPQVGAWYALSGTQVRPLNQSAVKSIGARPITVTAYQELVSDRYSDKLPGTQYNDAGMAGGYDANSSTATVAVASGNNHLMLITAAGGVLLLALLVLARRYSLKARYND